MTSCRWPISRATNMFEETIVHGERSNLVVGQRQYMTKHFILMEPYLMTFYYLAGISGPNSSHGQNVKCTGK
jgi:hypothetical protein